MHTTGCCGNEESAHLKVHTLVLFKFIFSKGKCMLLKVKCFLIVTSRNCNFRSQEIKIKFISTHKVHTVKSWGYKHPQNSNTQFIDNRTFCKSIMHTVGAVCYCKKNNFGVYFFTEKLTTMSSQPDILYFSLLSAVYT